MCRQALLANAEKKKGMLSETPFKMSSPMKESAGLGDFYGTLQGKLEYIAVRPQRISALSLLRYSRVRLHRRPCIAAHVCSRAHRVARPFVNQCRATQT